MAYLALVWQESDTAGWAYKLAEAVRQREQAEHHRLLGGGTEAIDLAFTFTPAPAHSAAGAAPAGTLSEIAAYYQRLKPGRLVVTGAPGAGKTVLALHLILLLLPKDPAAGAPVPVRLPLASFDPGRHTLDRWIAARLVRDYRLPARPASALVAARAVLPVLDGLDEMDQEEDPHAPAPGSGPGYASRASTALRAMNAWLDGAGRGQLVLTCRSAPYTALEREEVWAKDAARIEIRPVAPETAWDFLAARTGGSARWEPVMNALAQHPDGPLARALSTPWRLTVTAAVYERRRADGAVDRHPAELLAPALDTEDKIRDHLLGLFTPAATHPTAAGRPAPYTPDRVRTWLTVLAAYLDTNTATGRRVGGRRLPGTDLVLHELWPLSGTHRPRVLHTALTAATWLLPAAALLPASLSSESFPARIPVLLLAAAIAVFTLTASWSHHWPQPARADLRRLRNPTGRTTLVADLIVGLVAGAAGGFTLGAVAGLVTNTDSTTGFLLLMLLAVVGALVAALAVLLTSGNLRRTVESQLDIDIGTEIGPLTARWLEQVSRFGLVLTAGFVAGFVGGFAAAFAAILTLVLAFTFLEEKLGPPVERLGELMLDAWYRVVHGVTDRALVGPPEPDSPPSDSAVENIVIGDLLGVLSLPLALALMLGSARLRYLAFLLCTRRRSGRWLPWRLGRFLDWCCEAGLMRTAGIAYQFRHRELQDYLARTAAASPPGPPVTG
ncbi:NACHT domain-containing protein [Streptomyces sp. YIM 98790]|uniref:NACHT domain-containing protein n=1 Tax=Streptomyces sp. YIM 98790 TaxID=2689077 RepID=UPI00140D0FD8|nr:NACHT domain-containing protein [Streptomyces sp. YIM 98790]